MTTKLYWFARPPSPPELDLPAGEHSTVMPTAAVFSTDRALRGTLAPAPLLDVDVRLRAVTFAQVAAQDILLYQGFSGRLKAVQVPALTNWNIEAFVAESNLDANMFLRVAVFLTDATGTVATQIVSGVAVLGAEFPLLDPGPVNGSFQTVAPINITTNARLMIEVWASGNQGSATRRQVAVKLDRQDEGSFIEVPATLEFVDDGPRDFTVYDAYLDTLGVLFHTEEGSKAGEQTLPLRPVRQDAGNNPFEIRPEYGDFFAQGDFSHGSGQRFFHREGQDSKKYLISEGYDITEPGRLTHLYDVAADPGPGVNATVLEVVGGLPFSNDGTGNVRRGDGAFPGVWTNEDATVAHGSTVADLAAAGDELYALMANGHVHRRDGAGVWTHVVTLPTGTGRKIAWVKDRIVAVGDTTIYEVTGVVARALETLAIGWIAEDLAENGEFVYLAATNAAAGLSRIHHYGLDETGTLVKKGSTPMPRGQMAFSVRGYLDVVYIGAGTQNVSGGYDPVIYQAFPDAGGNLKLLKLTEQEGSGAIDLGVRDILPLGETVLCGWSLGAGAIPAGTGPRTGLAIHHLARDAFAHHLRVPIGVLANPARVLSIAPYKGRVLFLVAGVGLYYETIGTYRQEATLISSLADWSNSGLKTWDLMELHHAPLPFVQLAGVNYAPVVYLDYSTDEPENAAWIGGGLSSEPGSDGPAPVRILESSRTLAVRLRSLATPDGSLTPAIIGYSVRSAPKPEQVEFSISRFIRLLPIDRKDEEAEPVYLADVEATRLAVLELAYTWLTLYEADATWLVHMESIENVTPETPVLSGTEGESESEGYVLKLTMIGTRTSP